MAEYRSWRNNERIPLKDVVPLDAPFNLHIETSSVCNARCVYCGQSTSPGNGLMSLEMFHRVLEDAKAFPVKPKLIDLYYSGEPLCNHNFEEMAACAKNGGYQSRLV